MSKVILITGANSGIGLETARILGKAGHTVYIGARNKASGKEAVEKLTSEGAKSVKFVHLEVTDSKSIASAKSTIESAEGHLDVLVNNAGAAFMDAPQNVLTIDISVIRKACEVNFFGMIETTQVFIPLLEKSKSKPVILNISTDMASNAYMAKPETPAFLHFVAYNTSKAAANSYTVALASELKGKMIVNALTPGYTSTKLNGFGQGGPGAKTPEAAGKQIAEWAVEQEKSGLFIGPDNNEFPW